MLQNGASGDSFFHLLCGAHNLTTKEKLEVLADLKTHYRNPLQPNWAVKLCIDVTTDAALKEELRKYMQWPNRLVMEWFGPLSKKEPSRCCSCAIG